MIYDVLIIGGGPAGLSAALALGRARRRVLLCDAGPRRNATAAQIHNFVTRDGTPPSEFRAIARAQLGEYPSVEIRDEAVQALTGSRGEFRAQTATGEVLARRVILCVGMIDLVPDIEGFRALWGRSIFQCPYCHAWEVRERPFAVLARTPELLEFSIVLRAWTTQVTVLTEGVTPPPEVMARLQRAGIRLDDRRLARLEAEDDHLARIVFDTGDPLPCAALFVRPVQEQTPLVRSLGLATTAAGYVQVDEMRRETSTPGIYAAGDLTSPMQAAIAASAMGMMAAAALNYELTAELVLGAPVSG
jgi:thioredoxin reductase